MAEVSVTVEGGRLVACYVQSFEERRNREGDQSPSGRLFYFYFSPTNGLNIKRPSSPGKREHCPIEEVPKDVLLAVKKELSTRAEEATRMGYKIHRFLEGTSCEEQS